MRSSRTACAALLLSLLAAPIAAEAPTPQSEPFEVRSLPPPGSASWRPLTFPRVSRHTQYAPHEGSVIALSECSASALILELDPPLDPRSRAWLRWRWRADHMSAAQADERTKAGDDFPARVYVVFDFDAEQSSLWERTRRTIASTLYGSGLPGKAISYVWARHEALGSEWQSPYSADTQTRVLQTGAHDEWQTQSVDVFTDHARLLGPARMPWMAIALMTDSDDGCSEASARYADFELLIAR